jgi:hypothetical protein
MELAATDFLAKSDPHAKNLFSNFIKMHGPWNLKKTSAIEQMATRIDSTLKAFVMS